MHVVIPLLDRIETFSNNHHFFEIFRIKTSVRSVRQTRSKVKRSRGTHAATGLDEPCLLLRFSELLPVLAPRYEAAVY